MNVEVLLRCVFPSLHVTVAVAVPGLRAVGFHSQTTIPSVPAVLYARNVLAEDTWPDG